MGPQGHHATGAGTLGYGGPGVYPGFYGFGLCYHPGYGYGGSALGVGADGGYPFYGGPGYPHPAPPLRRFARLLPFLYNGSGPLAYDYPQSVENIGPLVANRPVMPGSDRPDLGSGYPHNGDFGPFTGAFPYPEAYFAPYTTAAGGLVSGVPSPYPSMMRRPRRP
jgi:hypothetical protein